MTANPIPIDIAVEDALSEAVAKRLLTHSGSKFVLGTIHRGRGFGYLRKTAPGWNRASRSRPLLMLTDLDDHACPLALIRNWIVDDIESNLIFRVAVREIESWILADWDGITTFLKIPRKYLTSCPPLVPEELIDPKAALIDLSSRSTDRSVKQRMVPLPNSTAKVGREYNPCLSEFVESVWDPNRARASADSLNRTLFRLADFSPVW
ncbi:MAG: hypothetical protein NTZ56_13550 [Acidobacteria bacterium]|nr:hypothetical protein [Acidobacteriota bacterium]